MNTEQINIEEEGLSFAEIFQILKNGWKWILATLVIGTLVSIFVVLFVLKPTYTSKASLLVDPNRFTTSSSNDINGGLRATETIANWIIQDSILEQTIEKLKDDKVIEDDEIDIYSLKSSISTSYKTTNLFVTVSFTYGTKEKAKVILDTLLDVGLKLSAENEIVSNSYNIVSYGDNAKYDSPNKKMYLLVGIVLSAIIGISIVFIKEFLKMTFSNINEVEKKTSLKVIGVSYSYSKKEIENQEYFEKDNSEKLLTNIDFSRVSNQLKVIEMTSCEIGDGKTTQIANLARVMGNNQRKCLIIDLDLRRSRLHKEFRVLNNKGITDFITNQATLDDVLVHINENIDIICSGFKTPNPTIILQSDAMKEFINSVRDKYEYIFLDCPPIYAFSDAKIITNLADGVILLLSANKTKISVCKQAIKELNITNVKMLGAIVTHLALKESKYYYSYYDKYHKSEMK